MLQQSSHTTRYGPEAWNRRRLRILKANFWIWNSPFIFLCNSAHRREQFTPQIQQCVPNSLSFMRFVLIYLHDWDP